LACNTCVDEMRGGARLGCVVNGMAGKELAYAQAKPPQGERIAVIGAGPAGLTYASLVADSNRVVIFERAERPGGSFRYAGLAPMFQGVEASEQSFSRYIDHLVEVCEKKRVTFRFSTDLARARAQLEPFDRIVIATGAEYRFGLGSLLPLLEFGAGKWPGLRELFSREALRDWFYYRARRGTGEALKRLARTGQKVQVIGDAVSAGKSKAAIASAFEAALLNA
jgi:phytoene dehydrogenase-like protein